jgi:molybdopterin synthase catalytic subunit
VAEVQFEGVVLDVGLPHLAGFLCVGGRSVPCFLAGVTREDALQARVAGVVDPKELRP